MGPGWVDPETLHKKRLFYHQDKIASGFIVPELSKPGLRINFFYILEDLRGSQHPVIATIVA